MSPFTMKVIEIIQSIPSGTVTTYGRIAEMAGNRRGARQVVRILYTSTRKYNLPWFRVVNSKGEIAFQDEIFRQEQMACLREDGVEVDEHGRVDLEKYLWQVEN
jgi:methylated-DNA-protein-cysteine methyltransferase-like protein